MLLDAVGSAASLDAPSHGADASFTYGWWFSKNACGGNVNTNGFGWEYMVSHCEEDCGNPYEGAPLRSSMPPPPPTQPRPPRLVMSGTAFSLRIRYATYPSPRNARTHGRPGAELRICPASAGVSEVQGDALKDGFHSYLGCERDTDAWFAGRSFSTGEIDQPASNFMRSLVVSSNGAFSLWDINIADTAALMTTEEWMHVVISVSPTAIVTYIDGQQMPDDAYVLYGHNGAAHTDANSAYQVPSDLKFAHDIIAFDSQPIILGARTTLDREFLGAMAGFTVWDGPASTASVSSVYEAQRPVTDAFEPFGPRIIVETPVILESSLTTGGGLATGDETAPVMIGNAVVANRAVIS